MDKKYIEAIKFVSQECWGEPTLKNENEWRFGKRLSKAIDLENATYFENWMLPERFEQIYQKPMASDKVMETMIG